MQVVLVMFRGDGERRSFSVVRNMTVIGRREDCDLRIPLGDVSRKHCRLVRTDEGIRIEDLGSSNGTIVNGQKIKEVELNPGDAISVGPVTFVVQIDGVPNEDEIVSPHRAAAEAAVMADDSMAAVPHVPTPLHEDELQAGADAEYPLDELATDEVPLEEAPLEEASLEEAPLEEAALEEAPLEEAPLEEASFEEAPLEEAVPDEAPLEELPLEEVPANAGVTGHEDELSLEEVPLEEVPLEEVPAASAEPEVPMEEIPHTAAAPATSDELEEMMLEEVPLEEVSLEEATLEELPAAGTASEAAGGSTDEPDWLNDDSATTVSARVSARSAAPPPPLPPGLAAAAEPDLELEEVPAETAHESAAAHPAEPEPAAAEPAPAGDWDFVVDESDAGHAGDLHIDFEESHHGQPHA